MSFNAHKTLRKTRQYLAIIKDKETESWGFSVLPIYIQSKIGTHMVIFLPTLKTEVNNCTLFSVNHGLLSDIFNKSPSFKI